MELIKQFCCPATMLFVGFGLLVLWWAFHTAIEEEENDGYGN